MSKNKKPRKPYRAKCLPGALPMKFGMSPAMKTELRLPYHLALDALKRGAGTDDESHLIFSALLVGREIAKLYQQDAQDTVLRGIEAITAVKDRGDESGKWGLSGDQFRAISEALVLVDELQDASTRREVRDAIAKVWDSAVDAKTEMRAAA